jgi:hypothetical protein
MLAKQAGMSYGKWKAMQPRVEIDEHTIPEGWTTCEYCGKAFKPYHRKRFCDMDCRKNAYAERTKGAREK